MGFVANNWRNDIDVSQTYLESPGTITIDFVEDVADRVEQGARTLNKVRPGWHKEIDLDSLELANTCDCVLGQVFGTYVDGIQAIENQRPGYNKGYLEEDEGFECDLSLPDKHKQRGQDFISLEDYYKVMDQVWIAYIKNIRA